MTEKTAEERHHLAKDFRARHLVIVSALKRPRGTAVLDTMDQPEPGGKETGSSGDGEGQLHQTLQEAKALNERLMTENKALRSSLASSERIRKQQKE